MMDTQPSIKKQDKKGLWVDDPSWIYPYANKERVLYCIRCEGHLSREDVIAVIGYNMVAAEIAFLFKERYGNEVAILTNGETADIDDKRRFLLEKYNVPIY